MNTEKILFLLALILLFTGCKETVKPVDSPVITLQNEQITRLIPQKGVMTGGIKMFMNEEPFKSFWAENWNSGNQSIQWNVEAEASPYRAEILVNVNGGDRDVVLELSDGKKTIECPVTGTGWKRVAFTEPIRLSKGINTLTLRIAGQNNVSHPDIHFYSLELATPESYDRIGKEVKQWKAQTGWMADIPYGFFFHWNSKSMPLKGEQKKYVDAVADFDVDAFARMVNDCGAKLIFFTTSWAEYYFPGPLKSIDAILPGRTTERDLVTDLSNALNAYGIRLILYYHIGHGDKEWWEKQEYTRENPGHLFTNLETIIGEIGERYGNKIAGLWMDDGMGYYPNGAPFDRITKAAKSMNKNFVICYNPWIFPRFTDYQDYFAGEVGLSMESAGKDNPYLPVGGNGIFTDGPQKGLQATYTGLLEPGEWTHIYKDTEIEAPLFTPEEMIAIIRESNKRKNLPMINVRVYQDGTISPASYQLLKKVKESFHH